MDGCAIENLKCEQRCDFSAQGYSCSCSRGYRLADNKQDCIGKLKKNKLDSFFDLETCTYDVNWHTVETLTPVTLILYYQCLVPKNRPFYLLYFK